MRGKGEADGCTGPQADRQREKKKAKKKRKKKKKKKKEKKKKISDEQANTVEFA